MAPAATNFKFCWLVELLEKLEAEGRKSHPTAEKTQQVVSEWFQVYGSKVPRNGRAAIAFLACIFPDQLPHRRYGLRENRLGVLVADSLYLPDPGIRRKTIEDWDRSSARKDFASTVQEVMAQAENVSSERKVTVKEIDAALCELAANSRFHTPQLKEFETTRRARAILEPLIRRLLSNECKWLIRMILKSYDPVTIPQRKVLETFHFLLPNLLAIQHSFDAAIEVLDHEDLRKLRPDTPRNLWPQLRQQAACHLIPRLGVMIKRQPYDKARSLKHCCDMARGQMMSLERKYDGEYCQIHIDMSKGRDQRIQIFSKSGKDSTEDRIGLHGAIKDSVRFDSPAGPSLTNCILEGELLVWGDAKKEICPFHVIRQHVLYGGRTIGTEADSPRKRDEHLMVMYYDMLYLNGSSLLQCPLEERRHCLEQVITQIPGTCEIGHRTLLNFGKRDAQKALCDRFAASINERWEGWVLKGVKEPYFCWDSRPRAIKLKRDYFKDIGDTADLCIVGGSYDNSIAESLHLGKLDWTCFYLACLENKEEHREFHCKPEFRIVDVIGHHGMSKEDILYLNRAGKSFRTEYAPSSAKLEIFMGRKGLQKPTHLFTPPFVVEIMGHGFEKPQNANYFVVRFPRLKKVHNDRTILETDSYDELQEMARQSLEVVYDPDREDLVRRIRGTNKDHEMFEGSSQETSFDGEALVTVSVPSSPFTFGDSPAVPQHGPQISPPQLKRGPSFQASVQTYQKSSPSPNNETSATLPVLPTSPAPSPNGEDSQLVAKRTTPEKRPNLNSQLASRSMQSSSLNENQRDAPDDFSLPAKFRIVSSRMSHPLTIGSSSSNRTRLPLAEILNPVAQQGSKRSDPEKDGPESPQPDERPAKKPRISGLRGGGQPKLDPLHIIEQIRLKCATATKSYSKEVALQILAHVRRNVATSPATLVEKILTSHWYSPEVQAKLEKVSRCDCADCRLILCIYVDDSRPKGIAKAIKYVKNTVVDLREKAFGDFLTCSSNSGRFAEGRDQKLVVFLGKAAQSLLAECDQEFNSMRNDLKPADLAWYRVERWRLYKRHFVGAIHFSFPKPFYSPGMAVSLRLQGVTRPTEPTSREMIRMRGVLMGGISGVVVLNMPSDRERLPAHEEALKRLPITFPQAVDSVPLSESKGLESDDDDPANVIWKWRDVLEVVRTLGCDVEKTGLTLTSKSSNVKAPA